MATITVQCEECGKFDLTQNDITLRVCSHAVLSYYSFACPDCGTTIEKQASDEVISKLISAGVTAEVWEVPAEAIEPKTGPIFTPDDEIDFHFELAGTDCLAALVFRTAA